RRSPEQRPPAQAAGILRTREKSILRQPERLTRSGASGKLFRYESSMPPNLPTLALAALAAILPASSALAHCFVGNRFFPATLAVDDPCVADELSLPTVSRFRNEDNVWETGVSGEFSKR